MTIPTKSYGILQKVEAMSMFDTTAEQMRNLGYAVIDSGYTSSALQTLAAEFERVRTDYIKTYSEETLRRSNEFHTIRAMLTQSIPFLNLALNEKLLTLLNHLLQGKFILNQQNGVINPPQEGYSQGAWHRDLPYQHFVASKPLAINALFCIDDFTYENGATYILPASHKLEAFPSEHYLQTHALQVEAKAGSFILLDCMLFHAGGFNFTQHERRAVNHVYTIPFFRQQINLPQNLNRATLSAQDQEILGFNYMEPCSIAEYILFATQKSGSYAT